MTRRDATVSKVAGMRRAGLAPVRSGRLSPPADYAWLLPGWEAPGGVYPATEREAMSLPPFGRGVELLAGTIAGLAWRAMRWDAEAGIWQRVPDQPRVLVDPYPLVTPWHYRWAAVEDLVLYGNHFALLAEPGDDGWLDDRTGRAAYVVPVPADEVYVVTDPSTNGLWLLTAGGVPLDPTGTLHVSAGARSGEILGRGVLRQYADSLGGNVAAERHSGAYFAGGALPPAVLQAAQVVTQEQADELKSKWRGMAATHEPVVLPQGYILTPLVSNAEQSQLVESRRWNAELVAMMLGVPSWKLGLPGPTMTYQNVDQADIVWIQDSVDRWAQPLAAAFSKWLMPNGTEVRWDYGARLRADSKTTAEVLSTLKAAGIITVDEARAVIGRPPLDDATDPGTTPADVPELTPTEVG